jgi:hypothetical protein
MSKPTDDQITAVLEGIKMSEACNKNELEPILNES